jgi:hypothetical protein
MSVFLTVDPGLHGAVLHAEYNRVRVQWQAMPIVRARQGRSALDTAALVELVERIRPTRAVIERQTPFRGQGLTSTSSIMMQFGVLQGVLAALHVPFTIMDPKAWRRALGVGDGKEASIVTMTRLQPELAIELRSKSKALQIAVADAWCMYETACRLRIFDEAARPIPDWAA